MNGAQKSTNGEPGLEPPPPSEPSDRRLNDEDVAQIDGGTAVFPPPDPDPEPFG